MFESLPDIPRLFTALAEWGAALVYVFVVARSASSNALNPHAAVPRWRLATAAIGGLVVLIGAQELLGRAPLPLWVPGMMSAYALMWCVIRVGTALDWRWVTHMSARAFIVAELAASLAWQVSSTPTPTSPSGTPHPSSDTRRSQRHAWPSSTTVNDVSAARGRCPFSVSRTSLPACLSASPFLPCPT